MAAKECPNCRLASPGSASFCACGWDFETGALRLRRPRTPRPERVEIADGAPERRPAAAEEPVALWRRVFLMPFLPSLWTRAVGWRFLQVAVPVLLLALLVDGLLALHRSRGVWHELARMANGYDAAYPAVVVQNGRVRVEGDRVIQWVDGRSTFLVDPRETIPVSRITTPGYLVVRETQILRKQGFRTEVTEVAALQALVGDPFRLDSATLRAFVSKWGSLVQAGMAAVMWAFSLAGEVLCQLYVLAAAGLALTLRGRAVGVGFTGCFRAALATFSVVLVLWTVAILAFGGVGFCVGVWLWPLLMTGLSSWAVGRAPDALGPARHF